MNTVTKEYVILDVDEFIPVIKELVFKSWIVGSSKYNKKCKVINLVKKFESYAFTLSVANLLNTNLPTVCHNFYFLAYLFYEEIIVIGKSAFMSRYSEAVKNVEYDTRYLQLLFQQ